MVKRSAAMFSLGMAVLRLTLAREKQAASDPYPWLRNRDADRIIVRISRRARWHNM